MIKFDFRRKKKEEWLSEECDAIGDILSVCRNILNKGVMERELDNKEVIRICTSHGNVDISLNYARFKNKSVIFGDKNQVEALTDKLEYIGGPLILALLSDKNILKGLIDYNNKMVDNKLMNDKVVKCDSILFPSTCPEIDFTKSIENNVVDGSNVINYIPLNKFSLTYAGKVTKSYTEFIVLIKQTVTKVYGDELNDVLPEIDGVHLTVSDYDEMYHCAHNGGLIVVEGNLDNQYIVLDSKLRILWERDMSFVKKSTIKLMLSIKNYVLGVSNKKIEINITTKNTKTGEYTFDSRRATIVRAHFRHYKSGLVTLVRSYKRGATNSDGEYVRLVISE